MHRRENSNVRRMHTAVKLNEVGDDTSSSGYGWCTIIMKMRCNQRKRCTLIESLYVAYILAKSKFIGHGFGYMSRYIFQAIVAKSHDAKLVILNLPGPPKVVGADKDCSCKTSSSSSSSSPASLPILAGLKKVWKLLIPKCESRNDLLHHHVHVWTNIVKCQQTSFDSWRDSNLKAFHQISTWQPFRIFTKSWK